MTKAAITAIMIIEITIAGIYSNFQQRGQKQTAYATSITAATKTTTNNVSNTTNNNVLY
ncbi:MAG: hypothetical protein WAZ77_15065 [Candidatus Nitrosopolaris sp.]|jgi:hypothetical protein